MSHYIQELDNVYSTAGTEWHGLAKQRLVIDEQVVRPLLFPLINLPEISGEIEGQRVVLQGYKALVADRRGLDTPGPQFVPLGIHSSDYAEIPNQRVWDALLTALERHPHVITTAGSLGNLRRFFVSVALSGAEGYKVGDDAFLSFLNFATSHDGSLALQSYDSNIRIVCQNTLNASLVNQGAFRLHVPHKGDVEFEIRELSRIIDATLASRKVLQEQFEVLQSLPADRARATRLVAGWKYITQDKPEAFGTPTRNTITRIVDLFEKGKGNHGRTVYDVLNGLTEHFSTGLGAGVTTTKEQRASSSLFGGAAAQKVDFTRRIVTAVGREELEAAGIEAVDNRKLVALGA